MYMTSPPSQFNAVEYKEGATYQFGPS